MGVRGLSGQHLAGLARPSATRTPAASDTISRTTAEEHAAPAQAPPERTAPSADRVQAEKIQAAREARARQEHAARKADTEPVLATHEVRLRVDKESKRVIAQLIDETNSVIKQIPPQELLEIHARFKQLNGVIFDREF